MTNELKTCPVCKIGSNEIAVTDYGERIKLNCPRCGNVSITTSAAEIASNTNLSPRLSAWLRSRTEVGAEAGEINSDNLRTIEDTLPNYGVSDRFLLLLQAIERRTKIPGDTVSLTPSNDFPVCWASPPPELIFLSDGLIARNLISGYTRPDTIAVKITPDGWSYLEEHRSHSSTSNQVFVAMSFADELKPLWENGIAPAIRKAQFDPYRVDLKPHIDRIDAKIISEIRNSRFMVADVTHQRPGVYFEAGFALGIGIPVFWSMKEDELDKVHFDTRQYNHIVWETPEELEEQLFDFIRALIGTGNAA